MFAELSQRMNKQKTMKKMMKRQKLRLLVVVVVVVGLALKILATVVRFHRQRLIWSKGM